jgi:hypothetical protein
VLAFLDGDVPQNFVLLAKFLEDVVASGRAAFLGEGGAIGSVACLVGVGGSVVGLEASVAIGGGLFVDVGGLVLVDFLEGLFHFDLGTGQHRQITLNYIRQ